MYEGGCFYRNASNHRVTNKNKPTILWNTSIQHPTIAGLYSYILDQQWLTTRQIRNFLLNGNQYKSYIDLRKIIVVCYFLPSKNYTLYVLPLPQILSPACSIQADSWSSMLSKTMYTKACVLLLQMVTLIINQTIWARCWILSQNELLVDGFYTFQQQAQKVLVMSLDRFVSQYLLATTG